VKNHRSEFSVKKMCRVLGVSRSGYYIWGKHSKSNRQRENERLLMYIRDAFIKGRGTYGSPRVTAELQAHGIECSKKRVAHLMKSHGIKAKTKRKFKATKKSKHEFLVADNLLGRRFSTDVANKVWVSDITLIWTREGWLYLAAILDVFNRKIIGWSMDNRLSHEILADALRKAIRQRRPKAGVMFHSDRGTQYTSYAFQELMEKYGFIQSMNSSGNCYDNALMESFFHTLKTELVYFEKYQTKQEARGSIFEYIEVFYNCVRRHSSLNYCSPAEFERKACVT
jgi:putative transposase